MARKPRREEVQKLVKGLLDSEIPEIQNVAKQLTQWIKQLEEHSLKLQEYVAKIEDLAVEEADALVDSRIHELVTGLEKILGEHRQKPRVAAAGTEAENEAEVKAEVEEKTEVGALKPKKYTTPDGMVIRKSRR